MDHEPHGIPKLPTWGRYRVPWFVTIWHCERPEFRVVDPIRVREAIEGVLCWICGDPLKRGRYAFAIGPMCTVNRVSAEPPQHRACAIYAAINCPFLSDPSRTRRAGGLVDEITKDGGMIERNPGVTAIWCTKHFTIEPAMTKGILWRLAQPINVLWYACGRQAEREEVQASFEAGCPSLERMAEEEGVEAMEALRVAQAAAKRWWPRSRRPGGGLS